MYLNNDSSILARRKVGRYFYSEPQLMSTTFRHLNLNSSLRPSALIKLSVHSSLSSLCTTFLFIFFQRNLQKNSKERQQQRYLILSLSGHVFHVCTILHLYIYLEIFIIWKLTLYSLVARDVFKIYSNLFYVQIIFMVQVRTNEKRPNTYCSQLDRCYSLLHVHVALLYLYSSKGK